MKTSPYQVRGRNAWRLERHDPGAVADGWDRPAAERRLEKLKTELAELQNRLYADGRHGLLLVLQAMDTGGKDGTIRQVMSGVNPQGCHVSSFKAPSEVERAHDFLWRIHHSAPARGRLVIFNRSHYEDVVVVRVHADRLLPDWARRRRRLWRERFEQINAFERHLTQNNIAVVKCFLHISREEQKKRLEARLTDPAKNWKFEPGDVAERARWDDYMAAYEEVLRHTSTADAPWHVVPADRKWFRNLVVAELLVKALRRMELAYPAGDPQALADVRLD